MPEWFRLPPICNNLRNAVRLHRLRSIDCRTFLVATSLHFDSRSHLLPIHRQRSGGAYSTGSAESYNLSEARIVALDKNSRNRVSETSVSGPAFSGAQATSATRLNSSGKIDIKLATDLRTLYAICGIHSGGAEKSDQLPKRAGARGPNHLEDEIMPVVSPRQGARGSLVELEHVLGDPIKVVWVTLALEQPESTS
jgi:hypothetical protein